MFQEKISSYGIGYMGSKSRIAEKLVAQLPSAKHFYDLFAGGCSISHRAMIEGRWEHYHVNDINPNGITLFDKAIKGEFTDEKRWVSKEEFYYNKNVLHNADPFISVIWSFGNNQKTYLYSKENETLKKTLHYALLFDDFSLARELGYDLSPIAKESGYEAKMKVLRGIFKHEGIHMQNISQTARLASLERLQRLKDIDGKGMNYEITNLSYENVKIEHDSVVYADIPYKDVGTYLHKFDYERFYEWASYLKVPVFISEYSMPGDRFKCVWKCGLNQTFDGYKKKRDNFRIERLFVPIHQGCSIVEPTLF